MTTTNMIDYRLTAAYETASALTGFDQLTEPADIQLRLEGKDWPKNALSMIGMKRMLNINELVEKIVAHEIPGDLMECGVWRGGAVIYMRKLLDLYGDCQRKVWVADSFEGIPPDHMRQCIEDKGVYFAPADYIAVSLDQVKDNFRSYGLLDDRVGFLPGWFKDTLPKAPIDKLALLRLDGDMYESTLDCLKVLYDKITEGGYLIIDDYALQTCRNAVDHFREHRRISTPITQIDYSGIYWRVS